MTISECVSVLGERNQAKSLVDKVIGSLFKNLIKTKEIFVLSADQCVRSILKHCRISDVIPHLLEGSRNNHHALREKYVNHSLSGYEVFDSFYFYSGALNIWYWHSERRVLLKTLNRVVS